MFKLSRVLILNGNPRGCVRSYPGYLSMTTIFRLCCCFTFCNRSCFSSPCSSSCIGFTGNCYGRTNVICMEICNSNLYHCCSGNNPINRSNNTNFIICCVVEFVSWWVWFCNFTKERSSIT